MKTILTVGVYDLLHIGHILLFKNAKQLGGKLIVAVQDGDYVMKYKPNTKLYYNTDERLFMVKSIRYVDEVVIYKDVDQIVKEIQFDIFATGPDQCHKGFQKAIEWCKANGKEHVIIDRTEGISSSAIKETIKLK